MWRAVTSVTEWRCFQQPQWEKSCPTTSNIIGGRLSQLTWSWKSPRVMAMTPYLLPDCLSKQDHFITTTSDITLLRVIWLFQDSIWKLHGPPEEVISDRGPQFVLNFRHWLSEILGIKVAASMAYHPQTDSQFECINQQVKQSLCIFVNWRQDDWYNWLLIAQFTYNDQVHTSTQTSPFMLNSSQTHNWGSTHPWVLTRVSG